MKGSKALVLCASCSILVGIMVDRWVLPPTSRPAATAEASKDRQEPFGLSADSQVMGESGAEESLTLDPLELASAFREALSAGTFLNGARCFRRSPISSIHGTFVRR